MSDHSKNIKLTHTDLFYLIDAIQSKLDWHQTQLTQTVDENINADHANDAMYLFSLQSHLKDIYSEWASERDQELVEYMKNNPQDKALQEAYKKGKK